MRIGLDVSSFGFGMNSGISVYLRRLAAALLDADPAVHLVLLYQRRPTPDAERALSALQHHAPGRVAVKFGGLASTGLPARGAAWVPFQPPVKRMVGDVDVYHAGEGALPRPDGTPIVGTVHDVTTALFPEYHTRLNRLFDARRMRWLDRNASAVAVDSEATGRDLMRLHPALRQRCRTILLARGSDANFPPVALRARLDTLRAAHEMGESPYVLCVGTLEPRKNQEMLVRAFGALAGARPALRLVLAGRAGWKHERLLQAVEASPVKDRIHLLGGVTPEELAALYDGATVFAYPSVYEGFGLPVLEAMSAGAPVVTSNVSSLPEVAGDAALLVDPGDVHALEQALAQLLDDGALRQDLAARGRSRATEFTWERTARETLAMYREAVAGARR